MSIQLKRYHAKFIFFTLALFIFGCVPPMRFSHTMDVQSPDGKTNLEVSSVRWTDFGLILGPEPPKNLSCEAVIKGKSDADSFFKINVEGNYKYSTYVQDNIDVTWSPDSNYFAVTTPVSMKIYDKYGNEVQRYNLGSKKRVSTTHWKKDESHGLYVVVKEAMRDLLPLNTFFHPISFSVIYFDPRKKIESVKFSKEYYSGDESDAFVRNDLGAKNYGKEFQEISADSKFFIYIDERKVRFYDFKNVREGVLFEAPDSLSWIWWLNDHCALFEFYLLHSTGIEQFILYNIASGQKKDITEQIKLLPSEKRHSKDWYKSLICL